MLFLKRGNSSKPRGRIFWQIFPAIFRLLKYFSILTGALYNLHSSQIFSKETIQDVYNTKKSFPCQTIVNNPEYKREKNEQNIFQHKKRKFRNRYKWRAFISLTGFNLSKNASLFFLHCMIYKEMQFILQRKSNLFPEANIIDFTPNKNRNRTFLVKQIRPNKICKKLPALQLQIKICVPIDISKLGCHVPLQGMEEGKCPPADLPSEFPPSHVSPEEVLSPLNVFPHHQKNSVIWFCHLFTSKIPLSRIRHDMLDNRKQKKPKNIREDSRKRLVGIKKVNMKRLESGKNPVARLFCLLAGRESLRVQVDRQTFWFFRRWFFTQVKKKFAKIGNNKLFYNYIILQQLVVENVWLACRWLSHGDARL